MENVFSATNRLKHKISGYHPRYLKNFLRLWKKCLEEKNFEIKTRTVSIKRFYDPRHPGVYVLPGQEFLLFSEDDDFCEHIFPLYKVCLPFSSNFLYADLDQDSLIKEMMMNPALLRLSRISQLAYLVPPEKDDFSYSVYYFPPFFKHTRWHHSYLTALLAYVILARNGFPAAVTVPFVLAAGTHDIAIPAGGDSVVRIDPKILHEENNYAEVMRLSGLARKWKHEYAFDLSRAKTWIKNKHALGRFLDVVDKLSYVALDSLAVAREGIWELASFLKQKPLLMDVWQDIRFTNEDHFYFRNPGRLYDFLFLRALEHKYLLFHPRARSLDFLYTEYVGRLYRSGQIAKNDLITRDNDWLQSLLEKNFPDRFRVYVSPDELVSVKFSDPELRNRFCAGIKDREIDHLDDIKKFNLCLDWPVLHQGVFKTLREAINPRKVDDIEKIADDCAGYYVYLKKNNQ